MIASWEGAPESRQAFADAGLVVEVLTPAQDAPDPWWNAFTTIGDEEFSGSSPQNEGDALYDLALRLPAPYSRDVLARLGVPG